MLPLAIGSLVLGGIQAGASLHQLNKLNKQKRPEYSISPELNRSYSRSFTRTGYGFEPEQRADYFNNVAGRYSQNFRNATQLSGGNQSQAIGRALQSGQLRDFSSFAAQDAQMQQQNIRYSDSIGSQVSNQRNLITGDAMMVRDRKEAAYGKAVSDGLGNIASAANFFAMNGGFSNLKTGANTQPANVVGAGTGATGYGNGYGVAPSAGGYQSQAAMNGFDPNVSMNPNTAIGNGVFTPQNPWGGANSTFLGPPAPQMPNLQIQPSYSSYQVPRYDPNQNFSGVPSAPIYSPSYSGYR